MIFHGCDNAFTFPPTKRSSRCATVTVTDGFLLRRGPLIPTLWLGRNDMPVNDQRWRRTMMLFTPACAPLRADPRFAELCQGVGFTDYWRRRNIVPDHLRGLI